MVFINLYPSCFKWLKTTEADSSPSGDGAQNHPLKKLIQQIVGLNLPELDKSVEPNELDVYKLLAHRSVVLLINMFITKYNSVSLEKKDSAKSTEYRSHGNKEYARRHYTLASYYYTMAIIYAPDVPENDDNFDKKLTELSIAYWNRSTVFYKLGRFEAALADIDHSLATGYPLLKQSKLLLCKVECLISLKRLREAKRVWEHLCSIGVEPKDDERAIKIPLQLLDIDSTDDYSKEQQSQLSVSTNAVLNNLTSTGRYIPSTDFSASFSTKVEPRYLSTDKGRHLVAKQDIEPGDILMVESPFGCVLGKHFEYHFCHHCYRNLEANIGRGTDELCLTGSVVPCTQCTRVLFCSTDCRAEAWRIYHQYECSILPVLYQMTHNGHLEIHLLLRILLASGLGVIQQVIDQNDESKDSLSSLKIGDPEDIAAHYGLVNQLIDLQNLIPRDLFTEFVIICAVLVQLAKKCAFVHTDEQVKFISTIVLRHFLQVYSNSCTIDCFVFSEHDKSHDFAQSLYPRFATLLNHSCEPNSTFTYVQSTELILRATKRIPAGSQVTINYMRNGFEEQEWSTRRRSLWNGSGFWCKCARCVLESRDGLNGNYFPIGCHKCGSALTRASSSSDTFHCSKTSCTSSMALSEAKQLYARIESHLSTATRSIATFESKENLLVCELSLLELSRVQGLRNCWQLGPLHRRLSDAYKRINCNFEARKHFTRYCEISEAYNGIANALTNHLKLIKLYKQEEDGSGQRHIDEHLGEDFRRIVNRAIELVQIDLLGVVETPTDGWDLLVDESRSLRGILKYLLETSAGVNDFGIRKDS